MYVYIYIFALGKINRTYVSRRILVREFTASVCVCTYTIYYCYALLCRSMSVPRIIFRAYDLIFSARERDRIYRNGNGTIREFIHIIYTISSVCLSG